MNRRDYTLLREDMNRRFGELKTELDTRFGEVYRRFSDIDRRLDTIDHRIGLIETDQKQFLKETGEIQGRLNELSRG